MYLCDLRHTYRVIKKKQTVLGLRRRRMGSIWKERTELNMLQSYITLL